MRGIGNDALSGGVFGCIAFAGHRVNFDGTLRLARHRRVTGGYISTVSSWAVAGCFRFGGAL
jgi:hypothetical protein